jgi:hypothetical protein
LLRQEKESNNMPYQIPYQKHRLTSQWYVRETRFFIFHLESPLDKDNDVAEIIKQADERHKSLREVLDLDISTVKSEERFARINWWFYSDSVIKDAGLGRSKAGAVNNSGIHAAMMGYPWTGLDDFMNHGVCDFAVDTQVGTTATCTQRTSLVNLYPTSGVGHIPERAFMRIIEIAFMITSGSSPWFSLCLPFGLFLF